MLTVNNYLKTEYISLEPREALRESPDVLLGVNAGAEEQLKNLQINTVFDLASSRIFANATRLVQSSLDVTNIFAKYGAVPADIVDGSGAGKNIADLQLEDIEILEGIGPNNGPKLALALDVKSVRDLALWPPYLAAQAILNSVFNPESGPEYDLEAPADLVPKSGEYPTERVQYEILLFDEFVGGSEAKIAPQPLGADGALDISKLLANNEGYQRPAIGGILTFTQSWYTKGLSLGSLIHGVALAPGESTKIAVIDWSRKTRTSATEDIAEGEDLESDLSRARAINEITHAVAKETQSGESTANNLATATQFGGATGSAGIRSPGDPNAYGGTAPGVETSGTSSGFSTGMTNARSWSTSSGEREIDAELSQQIVDRTHQVSHSARNRRASIVREVSQKESETISTRTLTNYNHMHALTVEYYEVVQLYQTVVELSKADRCLFVPMRLIDFRDVKLIDRYRAILATFALALEVREALEYPTGTTRTKAPAVVKLNPYTPTGPVSSPLDELSQDSWNAKDIRAAQLATAGVVRVLPDGRLVLPADAVLADIDFVSKDSAVKPVDLTISKIDGTSANLTYGETGWDMTNRRARIDEVAALSLTASGVTGSDKIGFLSVIFQFKSKNFRIVFPVKLEANLASPALYAATVPADVMSHLQDNQLYYSQAVWRSLDPATIGIMLSGYTWTIDDQDKPLVELVDPTPVAIVANYLVLRMSGDSAREHAIWLDKKKIKVGSRREDTVPVPSGGVFAEAVLGRFNSAEKLDITRFWNWQDSPIPIQAPNIAAIQAGSRGEPDNTVPGQLSTPVLNIVNPPSLPDPQGMAAILAAIQNGNMFRDMSGLAATIGLAQAGLAGAQQGASDAAEQAGKNAAVAAELGAKIAEIVGKIVAAKLSGGASLAGGGLASGSSSEKGAMINQGEKLDEKRLGKGAGGSNGTGGGSSGGAGGAGSGGSNGGGGNGGIASEQWALGSESGSHQVDAFKLASGGSGGVYDVLKTAMGTIPVIKGRKFQMVEGVDVAQFQNAAGIAPRLLDWTQVSKAGIEFSFIRATYGLNKEDPWFEYNWDGAQSVGIIRGAYHFFRPSQDAKAQAELFVRTVGILRRGDLPPVLDLEEDEFFAADKLRGGLTIDQYLAAVETWLDVVFEFFGRKPIIYTRAGFWRDATNNSSIFKTYPVWVANYIGGQEPREIPEPWIDWEFWQYTDNGSVPGISGPVDRNRFNGTSEDLARFAGFTFQDE